MSVSNESSVGAARDTRLELDRQPSSYGFMRIDDNGVKCCLEGLFWRRKAAGKEAIVAGRVISQFF